MILSYNMRRICHFNKLMITSRVYLCRQNAFPFLFGKYIDLVKLQCLFLYNYFIKKNNFKNT